MATLAVMKARITRELRRADLATDIASAIETAIGAYQGERWLFNERRSLTFSTVAGQEFYDSADAAGLGLLVKIDQVLLTNNETVFALSQRSPADLEQINLNGQGQPGDWAWYGEQLRIYPIPDAAYAIRITGVAVAAAPSTDNEASNPWMGKAERLIRSRAKLEIAVHVLRNPDLAADMAQVVFEAWSDLKGRTNRLTGTGRIAPMVI